MPKKFIYLYLPPLLWMAFIFLLSSVPHLQAASNPFWNFLSRKSAHIFEYFILGVLVFRALGYQKSYLAVLFSLGYSLTDEYHQSFVPQRVGAFSDIIYDLIGILLGIYYLRWKKLPTASKKPKS